MPAILVMTALFGTSTTGANLLFELQTGAHERMLVTPLPRSSLLVGRALKEMVPLAAQAVVIVVVMLPFGLRVDALGVLVGLVVLAVFGVGLGSLSYALAIAVRKQEWMFWAVQQTLLFPLMILSGMLLPLETGPGVDAGGVRVQPADPRRRGRAGAVRGRVPHRRGAGRGAVRGGDGGRRAARRHPRDAAQRRLNQRRPWTVCAP